MKCDIICLPHHGGYTYGTDAEMEDAFRVISPALALFPVGSNKIDRNTLYSFNQVLFQLDTYREAHYSGDRGVGGSDILVKFPYVPGTVTRVPHEE